MNWTCENETLSERISRTASEGLGYCLHRYKNKGSERHGVSTGQRLDFQPRSEEKPVFFHEHALGEFQHCHPCVGAYLLLSCPYFSVLSFCSQNYPLFITLPPPTGNVNPMASVFPHHTIVSKTPNPSIGFVKDNQGSFSHCDHTVTLSAFLPSWWDKIPSL